MTEFPKDFSEPVLRLISLGEAEARRPTWPDYLEFGITSEHIPELLRIITDVEAFWPEEDINAPEVYTPNHAWRTLGQLKAQEAIQPLIDLIDQNEELDVDWIMEEIPEVMGMIGPVCIPALREYLLSSEKKVWASVTVAHSLAEVGKQAPESRSDCVAALQACLENYATNHETVNAFLISYLADLQAAEAAPLVERAYQADCVDTMDAGDFEDYQIAVGLLEKRLTPPQRFNLFADPQTEWEAEKKARQAEERRTRLQAQKEKKKRKQAKKTRRRKRKKKHR
jgi:hypothetical protein